MLSEKKLTMLGLVLLLGICSLSVSNGATVEGAMQWSRTYGGPERDEAKAMIQTADGGFALAGYTHSYGTGEEDFWLVKTEARGASRWNQTYGGSDDDVARSVIQTNDEGFALAGYTRSFGEGGLDFWLVKTDDKGDKEWTQTYGGSDDDVAYSVIQTDDEGFALAGYTESHGVGYRDFWLVKTDAEGNEQWMQAYGGTKADVAYSVIQTNDEGFVLAGLKTDEDKSFAWLVKTDATGVIQWDQTYSIGDITQASDVIQTMDGGFALLGWTMTISAPIGSAWLMKTDVEGNEEWKRGYAPTDGGGGSGGDIIQTDDGGFAIAGVTDCGDLCDEIDMDGWLIKTDATGLLEWDRTYGGLEAHDAATAVIQTADRGLVFAGYTRSCGAGAADFWLVKTVLIPKPTTVTITESTTVSTTVTTTALETVTITTTLPVTPEFEVFSVFLVLPVLLWLQRSLRSR